MPVSLEHLTEWFSYTKALHKQSYALINDRFCFPLETLSTPFIFLTTTMSGVHLWCCSPSGFSSTGAGAETREAAPAEPREAAAVLRLNGAAQHRTQPPGAVLRALTQEFS